MRRCTGIKRTGEPCKALVEPPQTLCWWHDPANSEQRSKMASKAAKAKAGELHTLKQKLIQLGDDVLAGKADKGKASVAAQVWGVAVRAVEIERRVKETEELEAKLAELEGLVAQRGEERKRGA
jgi:hypothetical protein